MPDSPTSERKPDFVCAVEPWFQTACIGEAFYREFQGKRYCVLHFPGKDKSLDFEKALQRRLTAKNLNFRGVYFPDVLILSNSHFEGDVDFSRAIFESRV